MEAPNLYWYGGKRMCRECVQIKNANYRAKVKANKPEGAKPLGRPPADFCKRGHDLRIAENVRVFANGQRRCFVCHEMWRRLRADRKALDRINNGDTKCVMGHPLTPSNVYPLRFGKLACRTCGQEQLRKEFAMHGIEVKMPAIPSWEEMS